MGACYSSNEPHKIKTTVYNRHKKPTSCMGSTCCESGKDDNSIKQPNPIINNPDIKSTYNIYYKKGQINDYIDNLIANNQSPIRFHKINFIQLYNIFMNYTYDFTNSDFIICDTREGEKSQIFLKKFSQINYKPRQVESMADDRMDRFKNFLKNKNIIFILKDESNFEFFEQFITIFSIHYDINLKNIYILIDPIQKYDENGINTTYIEHLNLFIDEDELYEFIPKILINTLDIKSSFLNNENNLLHDALTFISMYPHIVNKDPNKININKFDINNICNENLEEDNIFLKFFAKFKIKSILNFISEEKKQEQNNNENNKGLITHCEAKRNKIKGEEKKILIKQKNISIPKNTIDFSQFYYFIQNDFDNIIDDFKSEIINNNCIIIEFDDDIDEKIKMKMLFIIVNKITGLNFEDIENYLKNNFFILNVTDSWPNKDEMNNFFN